MTDKVDNEQGQEAEAEVINLFEDGFDDNSLVESKDPETSEEVEGGEAGTDELPEKYRGKSIRDIIDMHQNLEKAYGRHNNELGELRQLTDQILKQQLETTSANKQADLTSDDLLDNPSEAINKAVASNPVLTDIQSKLIARERAEQKRAFDAIHPDSQKVLNDPRFVAWVQESPTRLNLFQQAHVNYDYELASELLNLFKTVEKSVDTSVKHKEVKHQMSSPTRNAQSNANQGQRKPMFRRADLMRLKAEDPDRYERLQPQILEAYSEGRVK